MMKLVVGCLLALAASASAAPSVTEMGTWDCKGSKPKQVDVAPGDHDYVWRGSCSGAEGFSVVVEPKDVEAMTKQHYDDKRKTLVLHIANKTKQILHVTAHVFVGFA